MSTRVYLIDRLRTLRPGGRYEARNPFDLLGNLEPRVWILFLFGFFAWTWDAFDFHSVTLSYPDLTTEFDRSLESLTLAVTLALMTRPIGGIIFGILADRYGRKWPFMANCSLLMIFVLATAFCNTFEAFLAVRALFGIAMGGIYGNAAATALEDCPIQARGLLSGIYQAGYPLGYVLASAFYKAFHNTRPGWRSLFLFGSAVPVLLIIFRYYLPETRAWDTRQHFRDERPALKDFADDMKLMLKSHWRLLLYLCFLVMGMVYLSHSTQDIYPWLLRFKFRQLDADTVISKATAIQTVSNVGGVLGGAVIGYSSQIIGRRLAIIMMCVIGGALLYPYTFTNGNGIYAATFVEQFCVQGAWSVIPIHLIELSPAGFRILVVGTSYQIGVLLASGSNSILTRIAMHYPVPSDSQDGSQISTLDFRIPICVFAGCVFAYVLCMAAIGPENRELSIEEHDCPASDDDNNFRLANAQSRAAMTRMND